MVKVVDYNVRETKTGEEFIALILQGDLTMVQSKETGRFYATCKQCSITSTFDETTAKAMIGREIPGRIGKVGCEAYDFTVPEMSEVILLSHRWEYRPEEASVVPMQVAFKQAA
jgi:hypothetical protein